MSDADIMGRWRKSPSSFIEDIWGLSCTREKDDFVKGSTLTHQQSQLIAAVEDAVNGRGVNKLSVASGHGTGKTAAIAMLIIWFLVTRFDAQVATTAPSASQIKNSLWKELSIWHDMMPDALKAKLEITGTHMRVVERPLSWFAQARTASRERPEALQGIHGEHVMILVDECSGVHDPVFSAAKGSLTGPETLVIYLSQYTRLVGEFHRAMTDGAFRTFTFSSEDSPIVEPTFCEDKLKESFGDRDADEYRIRVRGLAPSAQGMDDGGYKPVLEESMIRERGDVGAVRRPAWLGVDPAGEGRDEAAWVIRDPFTARVVAVEKTSDALGGAARTLDIMDSYHIPPSNVLIDAFGIGAEWLAELAAACAREGLRDRPMGVQVGGVPNDPAFMNRRAECYWAMRQWMARGGQLKADPKWKPELMSVRYNRVGKDVTHIMGKKEMRAAGYPSPGRADALSLTFWFESTRAAVEQGMLGSADFPSESAATSGFEDTEAAGGLF